MIPPLTPPDSHHLNAAQGWLALGDAREARVELEKLLPLWSTHPDVLELRWQMLAEAGQWRDCLTIATTLIELVPDESAGFVHRSFALHELKRTVEARDHLMPVVDQFPEDVTMRYNLACYECQLGNLAQARHWLKEAAALGDPSEIERMALTDPDLKPLWSDGKGR